MLYKYGDEKPETWKVAWLLNEPFFLSGFVLALAWRQMDTASSFSGFCVGISDDKALLDRD